VAAIDAVLLIAFGGPTRPEDIRPFLANVLRGRRVPEARIEEVAHHYEVIGGRSPLNELTFRQASALARLLDARAPRLPVYVGMRNWAPYLADTLREMADAGVRRALGILLAPHATEASRERYTASVEEGRAALGARAPEVRYLRSWHVHPLFVEAVAARVEEALARVPEGRRAGTRLVFTAHSVPLEMAAGSPYVDEVTASARAVAARVGVAAPWQVVYQSRSGDPRAPWLEPDVNDALRALAGAGATDVVLVPVGFVCDHVEVLYDLDVEAAATGRAAGLHLVRAGTVNDHPLFIRMLAELTREAAG
jgi:ferrochelatase